MPFVQCILLTLLLILIILGCYFHTPFYLFFFLISVKDQGQDFIQHLQNHEGRCQFEIAFHRFYIESFIQVCYKNV